MSDIVSGFKIIKPTYPVKPVQPSREDRKSGNREEDKPMRDKEPNETDVDDDKPTIDEYI